MSAESMRDILGRLSRVVNDYESPAEEILGERFRPLLDSATRFQTQVWVDAPRGPYRLDILLTDHRGRRIAIEVDGREFHNAIRDHWRTVFIITAKKADVVYRIQAPDLRANLGGVMAALIAVEPDCFNRASKTIWENATEFPLFESNEEISDSLSHESDDFRSPKGRQIALRLMHDADRCDPSVTSAYYDFAISTGLTDVDAIQREWELKRRSGK